MKLNFAFKNFSSCTEFKCFCPPSPIFGRSVNPIPTRRDRFCLPFTIDTPKFFHLLASLLFINSQKHNWQFNNSLFTKKNCFILMKIRLKWWHWCHSSYRLPSMVSSRFLNRLPNLELLTLWFWSTWWNVVSVGWLLRFGRCMLPAVRTLLSSYNYTLTPAARRTRRQQRKCGGCGAIPPQRRYIALPLACNNQLLPFTSTRVGITRKKKKKKTFRAH